MYLCIIAKILLEMKRFIILLALAVSATYMSAQINSPATEGYMLRGQLMSSDKNYQGAVDQLNHIKSMPAGPLQEQATTLQLALAKLYSGNIGDARDMLKNFMIDYPHSVYAVQAHLALADCDFFEGKYSQALHTYNDIDRNSLDIASAEGYSYRLGYCNMMLGNADAAKMEFASLNQSKEYGNASKFYQGYIAYTQADYATAKQLLQSVNTTTAPGNRADYYLAQIAYAQSDYNTALSTARKVIDLGIDPTFTPEMQRIAGESLYCLDSTEEAIGYLKQYVDAVDAPQPSTLYILGISQYSQGLSDEAINTLSKVTECDDAMGQSAYLYIGQSHLASNNYNSALLALEKAYRMNHDANVQETAFYNYAVAKMEGARTPFGSSVAIFEDFISQYPNSRYAPSVQEYIVAGYMTDNNYERALTSIERVKKPSDTILKAKQRVLYILGSRNLASGDIVQSLNRLKEAKSLAAYDKDIARECNLWIGDCYYRQGKYTQASEAYLTYVKATPTTASNLPLARYNLGYSRFGEKKYNEARQNFEHVIKYQSRLGNHITADAYNRLGDCYYYNSNFAKATTYYDKAYQLYPEAGDYALFQKAMMRGLTRDHSGKIKILDEMMTTYQSSGLLPLALLEKAETFIALEDQSKAIKVYQQLVDQYPTTAQGRNGHLQLAITIMALGDKNKAIDVYKDVIRNYPTSEEARVAGDDLKRIYADMGQLDEYAQFITSVPNAPKLETSEMDQLTFEAAEKAYLSDITSLDKLKNYLKRYPGGAYEPQALSYLSTASYKAGDSDNALLYATMLVERYPDSEAAEDALAIKGTLELEQGNGEEALATFHTLEKRASASRNIHAARLGIMRVARDLGKHNEVIESADNLLSSTAVPATDKNEIIFSRAYALAQTGNDEEAIKTWESIANDTNDLYGAKSLYYLAQHYFDNDNVKSSQQQVEKLVDSNTPHQYWLARGYILLSDIYRKQGNQFEADEYLKSLRDNYPGTESDIFTMIEQRLGK